MLYCIGIAHLNHLRIRVLAKGGGLFEFQPTLPPFRPPKVFKLVFLHFEILGERVSAKGAKKIFLPS